MGDTIMSYENYQVESQLHKLKDDTIWALCQALKVDTSYGVDYDIIRKRALDIYRRSWDK